jgi:hypothetical protein
MAKTIQILVESHDEIPEGCTMVFEVVGPERAVHQVEYEADDGTRGVWSVRGHDSSGPVAARVVPVSDSGAGTSILVAGGDLGLRLTLGDRTLAEPYLLLSEDAVVA